jgi:hypothetical protein
MDYLTIPPKKSYGWNYNKEIKLKDLKSSNYPEISPLLNLKDLPLQDSKTDKLLSKPKNS